MADEHCPTHAWKGPNATCYGTCRCRCDGCRHVMRERHRVANQIPPGRHRVPARKAQTYIGRAFAHGYSQNQVARWTGVQERDLRDLNAGKRGKIYRDTGRRIVNGVDALMRNETPSWADASVVRAMVMWLRDHGAPDRWIAKQTGLGATHVADLRRNKHAWVCRRSETAIRHLRDEVLAERVIPPGHAGNARVESSQRTHDAQKKARYERERRRRQRGGTQ